MKNKTNVGSTPLVIACCLTEFQECAFVTEFVHLHFLTTISRTTLEILEREFVHHLFLREIVVCIASVRRKEKNVCRDVELISSLTIFRRRHENDLKLFSQLQHYLYVRKKTWRGR